MKPPAPKLYTHASRPAHWITEADDGVTLLEWEAAADGWERRVPYRGPRTGLVEVWPGDAFGTGWPRADEARKTPWHPQRPARRNLA